MISIILYFSVIITILLIHEKKSSMFGSILIATCLLFIELPDIKDYKEHYELAKNTDFNYILSLYNFEPGYVLLTVIASQFLSFEIFYILIITITIQANLKFFEKCDSEKSYIYATFFLSICLYFIAFTLRTTIASIFLAYSLLFLKKNKNYIAIILIVIGATFHVVIAPMIIFPILNNFSKIIIKHYIITSITTLITLVISSQYLSLDLFFGANEILDIKISAYDSANLSADSFYFVLWILAIIGSIISFKYYGEFDCMLIVISAAIIILMQPFGFIQGRFMWLTSFVFAYVFTKSIFSRLYFDQIINFLITIIVPLAIFLRF